MTKIMNVMILAAMFAIGMASGAYAGKDEVDGDLCGVGGCGGTDVYHLECSKTGTIKAKVVDIGPNNDNLFGLVIACGNNDEFDQDQSTKPGKSASVKVSDCFDADISVFCDESTFCDDNYRLEVSCKGNVDFFDLTVDD